MRSCIAMLKEWNRINENLKAIPSHHIPRYIGVNVEIKGEVMYSVLCFCDAFAKAYATVIYLHQSFANNTFKTDVIFSKTHLAPDNITIPRLGLLVVLIGVRALKFVLTELPIQVTHKFVLIDSLCVLHWLQTKKPLSVFVTDRLSEIRSLEGVTVKHTSSEDNPADLATRGKLPLELLSSIWWNGPHWLKQSESQWPSSNTPEIPNLQDFHSEVEENQIIFEAKLFAGEDLSRESTTNRRNLSDIKERYLSLFRLLRVTTWVL